MTIKSEIVWKNDIYIILFEQSTQSGNIQNHVSIRSEITLKKCCLMILISSYLNNLSNQAIFKVIWPSDLNSHEKMLLNNTYIIPFEQSTKLGNIQSHVTIKSEITWKMLLNDTHMSNLPNQVIFRVMWLLHCIYVPLYNYDYLLICPLTTGH